jgi:hypothetical protein
MTSGVPGAPGFTAREYMTPAGRMTVGFCSQVTSQSLLNFTPA